MLHPAFHDLDQSLARAARGARHHPVESGALRHEGSVRVHGRTDIGSRLERRHGEVGGHPLDLLSRIVARHHRKAHDISAARPRRPGYLDRGHRVLLDLEGEGGLDTLGLGRDGHGARQYGAHEALLVDGGQAAAVTRPLHLDRPAEAAVPGERPGVKLDDRAREETHARLVDLNGCHRRPDYRDPSREGADFGWAGAACGGNPDRHPELRLPLGHASEIAPVHEREARIDIAEDAHPLDGNTVGIVGDDLHVLAQGQRISDLDDDRRGLGAHIRHAGPDLHRRRVAAALQREIGSRRRTCVGRRRGRGIRLLPLRRRGWFRFGGWKWSGG